MGYRILSHNHFNAALPLFCDSNMAQNILLNSWNTYLCPSRIRGCSQCQALKTTGLGQWPRAYSSNGLMVLNKEPWCVFIVSRSDRLSVEPAVDRPVRPAPGALAGLVPQDSDPPGQRREAHLRPRRRSGESPGLPGPPEDRHGQALLLQQNKRLPVPEEAGGQQQTSLPGEDEGANARLH